MDLKCKIGQDSKLEARACDQEADHARDQQRNQHLIADHGRDQGSNGRDRLDHDRDLGDLLCPSSDHGRDQLSGADSPTNHGCDQLPDHMLNLFYFETRPNLPFKSNCCYIRVVFILFYLFSTSTLQTYT